MRQLAQRIAVTGVLILSAGPVGTAARAQQPAAEAGKARNHFAVHPAASAIRVDGVLDEAAWSQAAVVPLTHEWFPSDNIEPPVRTDCLVTFDGENLYVGFRAWDPEPGQIRAYLSDRDTAFQDDTVGFLIDTFNDRRRAFELRVNPLGVQLDATLSDVDGAEDWSWDAIWASAGRITAEGYVVELAVPLKQLHFPRNQEVQTWGFLATRDYPRSVNHQIRSTRNERSLDCRVCQFDVLTGFQEIAPGRNLEVVPTVTARRSDNRADLAAPLANGDEEAEAGVSLRWGITPNVSLNAAINPDFSQVEADAAQLDVNEAFALSYPEKRPFFLEGADYFKTPYNAVFTRTVADPKAGLKLTGKEGPNVFGVFLAQDRINNLIFSGNESSASQSIDQEVESGVVRWRRDIGGRSTLGLLYTGRQGNDYANHVYGIDGSLGVRASDTVRFQLLRSSTEYPPEVLAAHPDDPRVPSGSFEGLAYRVDYSHATRDWSWRVSHNALAPEFRTDSGFIPRVDIRDTSAQAIRTIWGKPGGWYSRWQFLVASSYIENHDGEVTDRDADLAFSYEGPMQSEISFGLRPNFVETFRGVHYDNFRQDMNLAIRPSGNLGLSLYMRHGEVIDFANERQANLLLIHPAVSFRLGRHLFGNLDHVNQELDFRGERFLEAGLTQATLRYHLNVRAFVRAIAQYRDVERVPSLFNNHNVPAEEKNLLTQLLFSYKLNPQTVLLVGYSDFSLGDQQYDLTRTTRTLFLKIGYAWLW
ncbi:MAG TPA: DUF5916 domain-containing protein [Thermoanaerobaculia bacterium]|nr:DUF5916 domain-containing protein [Thermoanaerobaculia bacterium]